MTRWDRFKFWTGFSAALFAVGLLCWVIVGDTGDCLYFSQHATDC